MPPSTSSRPTRPPARSAIGPARGSSNATIRCSCASAWGPTSNTIHDPMSFRRDARPPGDEPDRRQTMDTSHNDLLGELAADAALERSDFIVQATEQLRRFLDHHKDRIAVLGGLTLIDDEPDYLSIAPDLSFRSRSRYLDDIMGEWVCDTEVIESAPELIELYNPADVYAAFAEAAREAAGMPAEPTAEGDLLEVSGISPDEGV